MAPDGSLFLADNGKDLVARIAPDGKYYRVAGTGNLGDFTDAMNGTSALQVPITAASGIARARDGSLYVVETAGQTRVYRIDPEGKLWLFFGKTGGGFAEDSLAVSIAMLDMRSVAVGPSGDVFVASGTRILRIGPNGRARTYAGNGSGSPLAVGSSPGLVGRADSLAISGVEDMVCDADGNLYFTEMGHDRVRRVSPDGRMTDLVYREDLRPRSLAIGPDGAMYVGQEHNAEESVYRVERDGSLSLFAGGLNHATGITTQNGQYALAATFDDIRSIAVGPDGALFIGQVSGSGNANGIQKVTADLPGQSVGEIAYPSRDASRVDYFTLRGQHLRTVDALTGIVLFRFAYDTEGRLTKIYDVRGDSTLISRNGSGVPTSVVAPYGQTTTLTLIDGYLSGTTGGGLSHSLGYHADGLLHTFTNPRSKTWTYAYSSTDGRIEEDLDPSSESMRFTQQESGIARTVTRESPEGVFTRYNIHQLMNGIYRRFREQDDGSRTSFVDSMSLQPPYGQVIRSVGAAGEATTVRTARDYRFGWFAAVDSVTEVLLPSGLPDTLMITNTRLFSNPKHFESVAFNGKRYVTSYDTTQRELRVASPLGRTWTAKLSPQGWLTSLQRGSLTAVDLAYDDRGKVTRVGQGWRALRYDYDGNRIQSMTDTLGRVTSLTYDAADRETVVTLPGSREIHIAYDGNGNVTRITPPGSAAHFFGHTATDLDSTYTPPGIAGVEDPATRYEFNGDRQLTTIMRPDTVVRFEYDGSGRLDEVQHSQGVSTLTYTSSPSPTGQVHTLTSADGTVLTRDYDGPLLKKETWSETITGSVERTFDSWLRDSTEKVNGGSEVAFAYDDDGLLVGAGGLSIHRRAADGLTDSTQAGAVSSSVTYNDLGEVAELHYTVADTTYFHQQLFRDALGRIIRIHETIGGATQERVYRYDAAGRLDSVAVDSMHVAAYRYDDGNPGNGNRTAVVDAIGDTILTADYDAQDRLLRSGPVGYEYTPNGELQRKVEGSDSTRFTYDAFGNLIRVITPDSTQIDYLIDGRNRRVGRKVDGVLERLWLYRNGLNPIAELDTSGAVLTRYVYGTRSYVPDLLIRDSDVHRIVTDYLGSVRAAVNTATGETVHRIDYDAWGVRTLDTAPGFQALGYAGGLTDSATALVRFGARDYEPAVGRWTSKDPIGLNGGVNIYSYAESNPLNGIDPDGLFAGSIIARIGGMLGGQSAEEIAVAGRIADTFFGAGSLAFESLLPNCVRIGSSTVDIRPILIIQQMWGGISGASLSLGVTGGLFGAGAGLGTATASVVLPFGLALAAGLEIGNALNKSYESLRGTTLGADVYDFFNGGVQAQTKPPGCGCP